MLETWARSRVLPQRQVLRAKVALLAAEGKANEAIAAELGCSKPTVLYWRDRFRRANRSRSVPASARSSRNRCSLPLRDDAVVSERSI